MKSWWITLITVGLIVLSTSSAFGQDYKNAGSTEEAIKLFEKTFKAPNWEAGVDVEVSAADGGKGFTGEGWETNLDFGITGDPRAEKGGKLVRTIGNYFPTTLQYYGKDGNSVDNSEWYKLTHESLLGSHDVTLEFVPNLATHWKYSKDRKKLYFRINPSARWSDGTPVTANDVVATYFLLTDETLERPFLNAYYGTDHFEDVVAESKYIVRFDCIKDKWRNIYAAAGIYIMPASVLDRVSGAQFNKKFQFQQIMGSGPYIIDSVEKNVSVKLKRRKDYWGAKSRGNVGMYNFDEMVYLTIQKESTEWEKIKKGEVDYKWVNIDAQWVKDTHGAPFQRGLIQKRDVYVDEPRAPRGLAMNMRKPPFDDLRIRKAATMLFNRDLINEKVMLGQRESMNSYFAGDLYESRDPEILPYDPKKAQLLLAEAGWSERDSNGYLVKDGQVFELDMLYWHDMQKDMYVVVVEDFKKAGIRLNLQKVEWTTATGLVSERNFKFQVLYYRGIVLPNPRGSWGSENADKDQTNNVTGVKDPEIDKLIDLYDDEYDFEKRREYIQQIDTILQRMHPWILQYIRPYKHMAYWNKFSYPDYYFAKYGDENDVARYWWYDAKKDAVLKKAVADPSIQLPLGTLLCDYWRNHSVKEQD